MRKWPFTHDNSHTCAAVKMFHTHQPKRSASIVHFIMIFFLVDPINHVYCFIPLGTYLESKSQHLQTDSLQFLSNLRKNPKNISTLCTSSYPSPTIHGSLAKYATKCLQKLPHDFASQRISGSFGKMSKEKNHQWTNNENENVTELNT